MMIPVIDRPLRDRQLFLCVKGGESMARNSISSKIYKLLTALTMRGDRYLYNREQVWSEKLGKACNTHQLYRWYQIDEYIRIHPDYVKRGDERSKRVFITSSFKQIDILLRLVDIYRGDNDEEGADNKAESVL